MTIFIDTFVIRTPTFANIQGTFYPEMFSQYCMYSDPCSRFESSQRVNYLL